MVTRKLTKAIRNNIADRYNEEVVNPESERDYSEKMQKYIENTPKEILEIEKKYPGAITHKYLYNRINEPYIDYGNVPIRMTRYYHNGGSPTHLSLESLTTFDDVREILPHLAKYLPV